jgi:hypothetical protein
VTIQGADVDSSPESGAVIEVEGGQNRAIGSDATAGGDVIISGGHAEGSYPGGNVAIQPGAGSPDGNVQINDSSSTAQMSVDQSGVKIFNVLTLARSTTSPLTCNSVNAGSVYVKDNSGSSSADGLCVCLGTDGLGTYSWTDILGGGGC